MKSSREYQEALDYLYSFVDYSLSRHLKIDPETFNLNRMFQLMEMLGNPQADYPAIHVAGTKGKGSTAAFVAGALQSSGKRVGFYTSPHLSDFCERIQVNRKPISHHELIQLVEFLKPRIQKIPQITTFEITTAAAFLYFSRKKVDYAVIEVGLGGRLDATNIITPVVSIITSLSMDHMAILGDSLEKIAAEKAGIIKEGVPVVSAPQKAGAMKVLEEIAHRRHAEMIVAGQGQEIRTGKHNLRYQDFSLFEEGHHATSFRIPLLGYHQVINSLTAFEALKILKDKDESITVRKIQNGFLHVKWPARFEILRRKRMIILDSAHNRESAQRLKKTMDDYFPGRKTVLIFGASEDKDIAGMLEELSAITRVLVATKSIHPRAMDPGKIALVGKLLIKDCRTSRDIEEAIKVAHGTCRKNEVILITGSIFIAAGARDILKNHKEE